MKTYLLNFIGSGVILSLTGCASIVSGTHQSISVESPPLTGASCTLTSDEGKWFLNNTPGSTMIDRGYGDLTVSCREDKYSGSTTVKSTTKGMAFGNILAGGFIGGAIDMGTGAAYDYPSLVTVLMSANS